MTMIRCARCDLPYSEHHAILIDGFLYCARCGLMIRGFICDNGEAARDHDARVRARHAQSKPKTET